MNKIKNMMRSIIGLCVICASLLVGCVHEDLSAVASVDEKIVTVDSSVNLYSYTITANTDWTFVSQDDWCVPSVTSGSGTTKVSLIIAANDTSAERTTTLTLTCGGKDTDVIVIQSGMSTSLEVAPTYITLDSNANDASIAVMANTSWSVSSVSDWVDLTTTSGSGNDIIKFSVDPNDTYAEREAVIYIAVSESISKSVTVKQLSQGLPSITLGAESVSLAKDASSHTISYVSNITGLTAASEFSWCTVVIDEAAATITVTALQNSTSSSRSSIVTVSGVVDGVTTSAQILVSQAGTGSPSISLLNSSLNFAATPVGDATVSWVAANDATVEFSYKDSWISKAAVSGDSMTVEVDQNTSTESRVGTIELKATNDSGEYAYYYVTVSQDGVGAATIYATPSVATLSAYDTAGVIYLTTSNVTLGTTVSSSNNWLSALISGNTISYTASANISDAMRTATLTVSYEANGVTSLYSISVSQDGLGAPVISSLDNVYMQTAAAKDVEYDVYLVDTDTTGTTLEVVSVNCDAAASTTTSTNTDWLSVTKKDGTTLYLATDDNTTDDARTATVTFRVIRDNAVAYKSFTVTQAGHLSAGISGLTQEIYVDHEGIESADADSQYGFLTLNGSTVSVMSQPDWMTTAATITAGTIDSTDNDYILNIEVDEYAGGETGSFREGYITLVASNGNSTDAYYEVLVRQYEPEAAMIDCISELVVAHDGCSDNIPAILLNGSEIESVAVTYASTSDVSWLTADEASDKTSVDYTAAKFTGPEDSRTATIAITVKNSNANKYIHYITVTQLLSEITTITATEVTTVDYSALEASITYSTTGSGTVTVAATTDASWVTGSIDTTTSGIVTATLEENKTLVDRKATIQLVATSADNVTTATTYATIIQTAAPETTLETVTAISAIAAGETVYIAYTADGYVDSSGDTDVVVTGSEGVDWINSTATSATGANGKIELVIEENVETESRSAIVEVKATSATTGSTVVKYVEVIQAGSGDAVLTVTPNVAVDYAGVTAESLTATLMSGAKLVSAESSETWLNNVTPNTAVDSGEITYTVDAYDGADGESRFATLTVKAVSAAGTYSTSIITVTQTAPADITISAPETVNAVAYDANGVTANVSFVAAGNAKEFKVSATFDTASWISTSAATVAAADGKIEFTLDTNTTSSPRSAVILLTAYDADTSDEKINASTATQYVTITQAAATATTLSLPTNISIAADDATVDVVYSATGDGDITVVATPETGTLFDAANTPSFTTDTTPISFADIAVNTASASRSCLVTVVATSKTGQTATEYLTITQAGTGEAMVSTQSTISLEYDDTTAATVTPVLSTNTTIKKVESSADWLGVTYTEGEKDFTYTATAYDGAAGASRIATITVTAENGGSYDTAYITVTQAAPAAITFATAEAVSAVAAVASGDITAVVSYVAGGDYDTLAVTSTENATWITDGVSVDKVTNTLTFTLTENESSASRSATVILTAYDSASPQTTVSTATTTVVITQAGTGEALISTLESASYDYKATSSDVTVTPTLGGGAKVTKVESTASWLIVETDDTTLAEGVNAFDYSVTAYDGAQGTSRIATLAVTATNEDTSSTVYITVTQAAPAAVAITAPVAVSAEATDATETDGKVTANIAYVVSGDGSISVDAISNESWITGVTDVNSGTVAITLDKNTSSAARSGDVILTASSDAGVSTASTTVTVTQSGTGEAIMSITSNIEFDSAAVVDTDAIATVTPVLSSGTTLKSVVSSADWLEIDSFTDGEKTFTYTADANTATEARIATITVTAVNGDTYATSYITVTQGAAETTVVTLTVPDATIYIDSTAQPVTFSVASTTTSTTAVTYSVACTTATTPIDAVVGDVVSVSFDANTTPSTKTHSVIVTAESDGVEVSKVVTIVQAAVPEVDATVVTLTVPEVTINVDYDPTSVSFSVESTTTELDSSGSAAEVTVSASCATDSIDIVSVTTSGDMKVYLDKNTADTPITHSVIVTATSVDGTAVSKVVTIVQAAAPAADTVELTMPTEDITVAASAISEQYLFTASATATSGETITYTGSPDSTSDADNCIAVDGSTGVVTLTLAANTNDYDVIHVFTVTATDAGSISDSKSITVIQSAAVADTVELTMSTSDINVEYSAITNKYLLTASATATSGNAVAYTVETTDSTGTTVTTLTDNSTVPAVITDAGVLTLSLDANTSLTTKAIYFVTVTATADSITASKTVMIIQDVAPAADAEVVELSMTTADVNVEYSAISNKYLLTASATATSGNAVTYSVATTDATGTDVKLADNSTAPAAIDPTTGVLTLSLDENASTTSEVIYFVTVTASSTDSDGGAITASKTFTVIQAAAPAAAADVVELTIPTADINVEYSEITSKYLFTASATTTSSDAIVYSIDPSTSNAAIDSATGVVTLTLAENQTAVEVIEIITVIATSGSIADSKSVTVIQAAAPVAETPAATYTTAFTFADVDAADATLVSTTQSVKFDAAATVTATAADAAADATDATATVAASDISYTATTTNGSVVVTDAGEVYLTNITANEASTTNTIVVSVTATMTSETYGTATSTKDYIFTQAAKLVASVEATPYSTVVNVKTDTDTSTAYSYRNVSYVASISDSSVTVTSVKAVCISATSGGVESSDVVSEFNALTGNDQDKTTTTGSWLVQFPGNYIAGGTTAARTYTIVIVVTLSDGSEVTSNSMVFTQEGYTSSTIV